MFDRSSGKFNVFKTDPYKFQVFLWSCPDFQLIVFVSFIFEMTHVVVFCSCKFLQICSQIFAWDQWDIVHSPVEGSKCLLDKFADGNVIDGWPPASSIRPIAMFIAILQNHLDAMIGSSNDSPSQLMQWMHALMTSASEWEFQNSYVDANPKIMRESKVYTISKYLKFPRIAVRKFPGASQGLGWRQEKAPHGCFLEYQIACLQATDGLLVVSQACIEGIEHCFISHDFSAKIDVWVARRQGVCLLAAASDFGCSSFQVQVEVLNYLFLWGEKINLRVSNRLCLRYQDPNPQH